MKFTDGYWLMRPGVTARYATEVADVRTGEGRLTLFAPVRHVRGRGDTLNSPLLTVECWSPAEGVIGVRVTHHAGSVRGGPEFALPGAEEGSGKVRRDGDVVELSSGELTLRVDVAEPWRLEFTAGGRVLTTVGERGTGFVTDAEGRHHMLGQLSLGVGELVYGLGERFTP
ncbi:alpha-xylosidase, partial [Kitasatospora sp. NPDC059827]